MKNIFKSINKRSVCGHCDGTKKIMHDGVQIEVCEFCDETGHTDKKLFVYFGNYFFEAERLNAKGKSRKQHRWSVEVNYVETMTQEKYDAILKEGGYPPAKVGENIVYHLYKQDSWGKSIMVAYKKAFKNLQKHLSENKDLKSPEKSEKPMLLDIGMDS